MVLIIDDEFEIAETTSSLLEYAGHRTLRAYDGQSALALYRAHADEISLVICDVSMPVMNGLDFVRACRREFGFVPVVMVSADGAVGRVTDAIRLGALDYLVKPYQTDVLTERLPGWLGAGRRQRAAIKLSP